MFLFRVVFWVLIMGFLFSGGDFSGQRPAPSDNPASQTADRVVAAVQELRTLCETRQTVCVFAGEVGQIAVDFATYLSGRVHDWLADQTDEDKRRAAAG